MLVRETPQLTAAYRRAESFHLPSYQNSHYPSLVYLGMILPCVVGAVPAFRVCGDSLHSPDEDFHWHASHRGNALGGLPTHRRAVLDLAVSALRNPEEFGGLFL